MRKKLNTHNTCVCIYKSLVTNLVIDQTVLVLYLFEIKTFCTDVSICALHDNETLKMDSKAYFHSCMHVCALCCCCSIELKMSMARMNCHKVFNIVFNILFFFFCWYVKPNFRWHIPYRHTVHAIHISCRIF